MTKKETAADELNAIKLSELQERERGRRRLLADLHDEVERRGFSRSELRELDEIRSRPRRPGDGARRC